MTAQKSGISRPAAASAPITTGRKAWHKKSPIETILNQIEKVREDVAAKEKEFLEAKRQLQKLEEFKKVLEAK